MPLKDMSGNNCAVYWENKKPVNMYLGDTKIAGWIPSTKQGESVSFTDTYNDTAEVIIEGNTVQESDYYAKNGLSSQNGTPTPDNPIPIISGLAVVFGLDGDTISTISGAVISGASLIAYISGEAKVDAAREGKNNYEEIKIGGTDQ